MSIFHLLNLVQLELRSASESILPVKIIWVGLNNSNYKVRLMKSSGSEPGLIRRKKKTTQKCLQFTQKGNPPSYPKARTSQCFHKMIHFRHVFTLLFAVTTLCWPGHWPASNAFLHLTHLQQSFSSCFCFNVSVIRVMFSPSTPSKLTETLEITRLR